MRKHLRCVGEISSLNSDCRSQRGHSCDCWVKVFKRRVQIRVRQDLFSLQDKDLLVYSKKIYSSKID